MDSLKLCGYITFDVNIFGVKGFLKRLLGLSQILHFDLVCFYACINIVEFFLIIIGATNTSAAVSLSLNIGLDR